MYLCVLHRDIKDWDRFDALGAQFPHAPDGCSSLAYFPSKDHRCAVVIWRAADPKALRDWIDRKAHGLSTVELMEVDERHAMGLPKVAAHA